MEAVREVTGAETATEGIPVHGMLDPEILTLMMQSAGFDAARIREGMPGIVEAAQRIYEATVPDDLRASICPGVSQLLESLLERGDVLALVTGNLTRIGWRKLGRAGLDRYFRFGAFGEMAATRGGLAKLAIDKARRDGLIDPDASVSLIGDAPQDIQAARENGVRSIAVRTGITPPGDLEACSPDYLFDDLTKLEISII